jgi:hypothetical protein
LQILKKNSRASSAASTHARSNPVNTAATLTLGTADGPGILNMPAVASGETEPFEQTFAALAVNGTGNVIDWANGSGMDKTIGCRLSFGAISCAAGSSLTIPAADSTFKVYVTDAAPGRTYPCIHFADKPDRNATVAADGQLVSQPAPFVLVVR